MAYREPGDPRCKDCPEPRQRGRARCAACELEHRRATRLRRLELRRRRLCLVCSAPVVKRPRPRRYCAKHLRYYAARAAVACLAFVLGCGDAFESTSTGDTGHAGAGSPSVAGSGGASVAGASALSGAAGSSSSGATSTGGVAGSTLPGNEAGNGGEPAELAGAGGVPSSPAPVACERSSWTLEAFASGADSAPALALDGSTETRWTSELNQEPGQWLALELGAPLELAAFELVTTPGDEPEALALELDDVPTPAALELMGPGVVRLSFEPTAASSARFELVNAAFTWWSVAELGGLCVP